MTMESMKKGVLELIYNRTRYLFYNPADSISPIVPNNLRDLFNLIALLAAMEEIPDSRELTKKACFGDKQEYVQALFVHSLEKTI